MSESRRRRESGDLSRCRLNVPRLDTTQSKLQVLYSKQGRAQQFTTQAARDRYLNAEIRSLRLHERTQQKCVEDLGVDVEGAKVQLSELVDRAEQQSRTEEERRESLRKMGQEISDLKAAVDGQQEQRKWES